MSARLTIGDFSRMTYLSVKALRHYQDLGILVPAAVDPITGYRLYHPSQVPTAQVIRRFRDLGMPLDQVKAVLDAPDVHARNELLVAHLRRMESQLEQTQATVAWLRLLLERSPTPIAVEYRSVPTTRCIAIAEPVAWDDSDAWSAGAFEELHSVLSVSGVDPAGPAGALYSNAFFEVELGAVTAFIPLGTDEPAATGRAALMDIPTAELAVTMHEGGVADIDQTYGALGTYVAEREIGVEGPIRETYVITAADTDDETAHRTEVGWPVFRTATRG
jgi:DNA-binding transcriptional MerR regulator/effector-binding domain-containing protein